MDYVEGTLHILLVGKISNSTSLVTYIHCLSYFFFKLYIGEVGKEGMMDYLERRQGLLVALALYWCLHMIV